MEKTRRRNTGRAGNKGKFDSLVRPAGEPTLQPLREGPRERNTFQESLEHAREFFETHHRAPDRASADPAERRLANWVDQQHRYNRPGGIKGRLMPEQRRAELDTALPWWNELAGFEADLERAVSWLNRHPQERPVMFAEDAEERVVAAWLIGLIRPGSHLSPAQRARLDEAIPDWADDRHADKTERAGEWVRAHGRLPAQTAKDPYERVLGIHLRDSRVMDKARSADDPTASARRKMLDEHVPGWRGVDLEVVWRDNALEAMRWERENGRPPKTTSNDPDEARIAKWRSKMMTLARASDRRITPERRAFVQDALRGEPDLAGSWAAFEG